MTTDNCEYVRRYYGVPAEIGRRVRISGKPGIISADRGQYIGVTFDSDKPGVVHNAHPTSEVKYLELGSFRKLTRGQQRYRSYLEVVDLYESFAHYLRAHRAGASQDG